MEEKGLGDLRKTLERSKAPFRVLDGKGGAWRKRYTYLYVYLIDAQGVVRTVFGSTIHARPHGAAVAKAFARMVKGARQ